jgi:hypothetical protein
MAAMPETRFEMLDHSRIAAMTDPAAAVMGDDDEEDDKRVILAAASATAAAVAADLPRVCAAGVSSPCATPTFVTSFAHLARLCTFVGPSFKDVGPAWSVRPGALRPWPEVGALPAGWNEQCIASLLVPPIVRCDTRDDGRRVVKDIFVAGAVQIRTILPA